MISSHIQKRKIKTCNSGINYNNYSEFSPQRKRRNLTSATQGESVFQFFWITSIFLRMNPNLVLRTQSFYRVHSSTARLWNQMYYFSLHCEVFQRLGLLPYICLSRLLFSPSLLLFLSFGFSAWVPCLHCLAALCFLAHLRASLLPLSMAVFLRRHLNGLLSAAHYTLGLWMEIRRGLVDISHCP